MVRVGLFDRRHGNGCAVTCTILRPSSARGRAHNTGVAGSLRSRDAPGFVDCQVMTISPSTCGSCNTLTRFSQRLFIKLA